MDIIDVLAIPHAPCAKGRNGFFALPRSSHGNWTFAFALLAALLLVSGTLSAACSSYDQNCGSDSDCCSGMVCGNFGGAHKCTQPSGVCTTFPQTYSPPPVQIEQASPNGPLNVTKNLSEGRGISGPGGTGLNSSSSLYKAGWFSDWMQNGLIGAAIALAIVAIAAMVGHGFNLAEAKAFANSEMMQAVMTVLLVGGLLGTVAFLDAVATQAIAGADLPVTHSPSEPIYITAAKYYLTTLYDTAEGYASGQMLESIKKQSAASAGTHRQANWWLLLFFGVSERPNAGVSIEAERASAVLETTSKLMASIYAQRYFIDVVAYGIAPVFLLLGIVLRTFFFSRKLGGLLLAIAISLFIVYPLTYAFAWYTLNVTIYGDRMFGVSDPSCPAECTTTYPASFYVDSATHSIVQFQTTQQMQRAGINDSNWNAGGPNGEFPGLVACRDLSTIGITSSYRAIPEASGAGVVVADPAIGKSQITDSGKSWAVDAYKDYTLSVQDETLAWSDYAIEGNDANSITVFSVLPQDLPSYQYKVVSPAECAGCPDYCREVPFPAGLPGCNISKCSSCNAGCKIIRQRTDCATQCDMSTCPKSCRLQNPVENKCYFTSEITGDSAHVAPADLSISCEDCGTCPTWCKILEKKGSTYEQVYKNEPACQKPSCIPPTMTVQGGSQNGQVGVCPQKCLYVTELGTGSNCQQECGSCPTYCRVKTCLGPGACGTYNEQDCAAHAASGCSWTTQLDPSNPPAWDVTNPTLSEICTGDTSVVAACNSCPDACKTQVPPAPQTPPAPAPSCAPYPGTTAAPSACTQCPLYCRWPSYSYLLSGGAFYGYSGALMDGNAPYYCSESSGAVSCSGASCDSGLCKATSVPLFCREYSATSTDDTACTLCQTGVRIGISRVKIDGTTENVAPALDSPSDVTCSDAKCPSECKPSVSLPSLAQNPDCKDYDPSYDPSPWPTGSGPPSKCELCKTECRISDLYSSIRSPSCQESGTDYCTDAYCPSACKTQAAQSPPICMEYLGNGAAASTYRCNGQGVCPLYGESDCHAHETDQGCSWAPPLVFSCHGPGGCPTYTQEQCAAHSSTCSWAADGSVQVPIDQRLPPYDQRSACRQCPEYCRVKDASGNYQGDCGLINNGNNQFIDCSSLNCPDACRVDVPSYAPPPDPRSVCGAFDEQSTGLQCQGCPAICRSNDVPPSSQYGNLCSSYPGCSVAPLWDYAGCYSGECRLGAAPAQTCTGCFSCPYDCTFYPAVRSDCSDVCTDEALTGALNVGPDDFIRKLPGAQGAADVSGVGRLMVPALVLPLFCIVIVVSFIRVFSPILGGDMEISGLGRII